MKRKTDNDWQLAECEKQIHRLTGQLNQAYNTISWYENHTIQKQTTARLCFSSPLDDNGAWIMIFSDNLNRKQLELAEEYLDRCLMPLFKNRDQS
jgi:hypothetical protein